MPKKLEILDKEGLKESLQSYFSTHESARFVRRLDVLLLLCNGHTPRVVAKIYKLNPTTIQRWIKRVNEYGLEGLRDKPKKGRTPRLSKEDLSSVKSDLLKIPVSLGYDQERWDGVLLSHHIEQKYGVILRVRSCQMLFHHLGFSLQRPRKMPISGNSEEREAFKKTP
jgi:transposase